MVLVRNPGLALALCVAVAGLALLLPGTAAAGCSGQKISTADGCRSESTVQRELLQILGSERDQNSVKATIAKVRIGDRTLIRAALGQSQTGVPATPDMNFRIGSIAIPNLTTVLLQLQDRGRLSIDDPLSRWFPELPRADEITLKMLANNTSGYYDYIQGNQDFVNLLLSDVFRQWTPRELLDIGLARGFACDPGTCFSYAHTNYIILSDVVSKITGVPTRRLIQRRILNPLKLDRTRISRLAPMPGPVLHAFGTDRGPFEDTTFWSPSWTIGAGTVLSSTIDDVTRAARPIFTGKLLSKQSRRQMFAPDTVGLGPMNDKLYFGLGLLVSGGWRYQNPQLNGWTAVSAYLHARKLTVSLVTTKRKKAADGTLNPSAAMAKAIAEYLAPGRTLTIPTG